MSSRRSSRGAQRGDEARLGVPAILVSIALFAAQSCSLTRIESMVGLRPTVTGAFRVQWRDGTESTLGPRECVSGDRANFRGVDLISPPFVLRVAADPLEGLGVAILGRGNRERPVFRTSACRVLSGDVNRSGWRVNDVWDVSGYVEADCRIPSGEELEGKITFENCH